MTIFKKLFRKDSSPRGGQEGAAPLAIEGTHTHFTPEPDDAELAAQAVLELMAANGSKQKAQSKKAGRAPGDSVARENTSAYYHALADRIREAHRKSARQAARFVAFCEYKLQDKHLPFYGPGSMQLLETELYKRIDIIEREGGKLKRRWQHCLAEVTVRLMDAPPQEENVTQKAQIAQKE